MSLLEQATSFEQYNQTDMDWESEGRGASPARQFLSRSINLQSSDVNGKRILDVGCGTGWFLQECLTKGARQVVGLEPSNYANSAKNNLEPGVNSQIKIVETKFEDYQTDEKFDLISFIMATEHLADPHVFLSKARNLLNVGGRVLIVTADRDRFMGDHNDAIVTVETIIEDKESIVRRERPNGYGTTIDIVRSVEYWLEIIDKVDLNLREQRSILVDEELAAAEPHKARIVGKPVFQLFWLGK